MLDQGETIGEYLAGMLSIRQRVDDRNRGIGGERADRIVRERAGRDEIDPAREVSRDVADRFPLPEPDVAGRQVDGRASELRDRR
jgi:hypothetical protein